MGSLAIPGYTMGRDILSPAISMNVDLTQHGFVPSTQTQSFASVLPISLILAPARKAYKYRYSAPGPYLQLNSSAVTLAFKLSTVGMGLAVLVSVGGGVIVDVKGMLVGDGGGSVSVDVRLVDGLSTVAGGIAEAEGFCPVVGKLHETVVKINRMKG